MVGWGQGLLALLGWTRRRAGACWADLSKLRGTDQFFEQWFREELPFGKRWQTVSWRYVMQSQLLEVDSPVSWASGSTEGCWSREVSPSD